MTYHINYLKDSNGKTKAVQIPFKEWLVIAEKIAKSEKKKQLLEDLSLAAKEIRDIESGKKKSKTFEELLNEL